MTDHVWLTYKELADRLGIGADSARHKARRRKWEVQSGNHPRDTARVKVPLAVLKTDRSPLNPLGSVPIDPIRSIPIDRGHDPHSDPHIPSPSTTSVIPLAEALAMVAVEREQADRRLVNAVAEERAETARRLAERDSLHLGHIERLLAQAGIERSLWLERVDAAEVRAERVEQRLDLVLDQMLADRRQPTASQVAQVERAPWWRRWFGSSSKSDLGRG